MKMKILLFIMSIICFTGCSNFTGKTRKQVQYSTFNKMLPISHHESTILRHPSSKLILFKDELTISKAMIKDQPYAIFALSKEFSLQDITVEGYIGYYEYVTDIKEISSQKSLTTEQLNLIQTSGLIIKLFLPQWEDQSSEAKIIVRYTWNSSRTEHNEMLTDSRFELKNNSFWLPASFRGENAGRISIEANKDYNVKLNNRDGNVKENEYTNVTTFEVTTTNEDLYLVGKK